MKNMCFLAVTALLAGCGTAAVDSSEQTTGVSSVDSMGTEQTASTAATTESAVAATDGDSDVLLTSFTAGQSATLEVPEMSCQINCYPKVKKTLEEITGVKSVELMPQADEVVIDDHRVKVEFDGSVDRSVAIAALADAGYPGAQFKNATP